MYLQRAFFSCWCFCWLLHAAPLTHSLNYVSNNHLSRIDIREDANVFLIIQTRGWWCSICKLDVLTPLLECYKQNKSDDRPHLQRWRICLCLRGHLSKSILQFLQQRWGLKEKAATNVWCRYTRSGIDLKDKNKMEEWHVLGGWAGDVTVSGPNTTEGRLGFLAAMLRWRHRGRQLILLGDLVCFYTGCADAKHNMFPDFLSSKCFCL